MESRVLNILTSKMYSNVGTFSWGFKHTNDNAVRELFIYFRKSTVGTCYTVYRGKSEESTLQYNVDS